MQRLRIAGAVACFLLLWVTHAAASGKGPQGPRAVIQVTVEEVLAVLGNDGLSEEERRARIEQIAYGRFDMTTMSKLVLRRGWKKFSPEQREEWIREFKRYLANNYGDRIDRYDQQTVDIVGERTEPNGDVTIRTRIVGGDYEGAAVDYRMREKNGQWRVIDVVIEGISLVSNYGDQFREILSRGGPDQLLKQIKKKNARLSE